MTLRSLLHIFLPPKAQNKSIAVLVIDDSEVDLRIACAAIERGGYIVLQAHDGESGLVMAREHKPDLIILDYQMPGLKGPEVCKILKSEERTRDIPVLFLTSLTSPGSVIDCYEQGGENYLAKPINPRFLLKQIEQVLKDKN